MVAYSTSCKNSGSSSARTLVTGYLFDISLEWQSDRKSLLDLATSSPFALHLSDTRQTSRTMSLATKFLCTVFVLYIARVLHRFHHNIAKAQAIGLPVKIVSVDQSNVFWLVLSPLIRHLAERILPPSAFRKLNLAVFGWEFGEKRRPFDELSTDPNASHHHSFILAGLQKLELWTTDTEAIQDILHRTHAFEVPAALEFALDNTDQIS